MVPSSADIVLQKAIRNKYDKYLWRGKYKMALHMRGWVIAAMKISLRQYFRLLLDCRYIWTSQRTNHMAYALMPTNYFVVVILPSRQIKRVVRLTACNYERCVSVAIFSGWKIRLRRLQIITLDKLMAAAITSIQPSKYVLDVNLRTVCQPSWGGAVSLSNIGTCSGLLKCQL